MQVGSFVVDRKVCLGCGVCAVLLGFVHSCLKIWYCFRTEKRLLEGLDHIPGCRGHWLAGSGLEMKENMLRQHEWKLGLFGKSKFILNRVPIFAHGVYCLTTDPKVVKHILKDKFDIWSKPDYERDVFFSQMSDWLGQGIFVSLHGPNAKDQGQLWSHSRKTASAIFTKDNFSDLMTHTFQEQSKIFLSVLDKVEKGKVIDMQRMFFAFTMDSIMKIFFGRETRTMLGTNDPYATAYDEAHRSMVAFFMKNFLNLSLSDLLPWPFGPFKLYGVNGNMAKFLRSMTKEGRSLIKNTQILHKISLEIIDAKLNDPNLKSQRDLLSLFMNAEDENGGSYAQKKHREFLTATVLNFVIAGRDTTACTLTWMFYILSTNPEIQRKLCEEIDQVIKGREPTHDDLSPNKMPYLNGVLYETLRLYPPVPEDPKNVATDDILPDGTKLKAGTTVAYFAYGMGRDPDVYPDPLTVKPERWIPFNKPSDFDFPVFQAGPRICLGVKMAILEAKILTCFILQKYTFTLLEGEAEKIVPSLMVTMSLCNSKTLDTHNLWLIPQKREQKL